MVRTLLLLAGLLAPLLAVAEPVRTLLLELRHVPEDMRASSGVEAGPGTYSYDSYDRERVLSVVRDTVLMLATPEELAQAKAEGLDVRVLMESNDKLTLIRRALYGPTLKPTVYHTYARITQRADELMAARPGLMQRAQIGETTRHRQPIYAYRLANDVRQPQERPAVLLNGCHHADEVLGAEIVVAFMERLMTGYGTDAEVTRWLDTLEIWLVPVVNVDGHDVVTSGQDPRWRKNLRDVDGDGTVAYPEGVDVNRGYDFNWALGGTSDPAKVSYRGPHPFSEAENRAMRRLAEMRQFLLSISYHSQGEVIFYPWTWNGKPAPDDEIIRRIAGDVAANIPRMDGSGTYAISPGGASSQSYPWFYGRHGTFDMIIETGKGAHLFPPHEVPGIVAANLQGVTAWLRHAEGPGLAVKVTDAATGAPLVAQVWLPQIENETVDRRTTDATFGRRWRLLEPGSHQVIVSCPGYRTVALRDVAVGEKGWTPLELKLERE